MQGNTDNVIFEDGAVLNRKQCEEMFGDCINSIADFSTSLYRMSLDISALACMEALTLVTRKCLHTAMEVTPKILENIMGITNNTST